MSGGIVTECPECHTRFNVTDGQLKLADGRVRCGACLRVFDALENRPDLLDNDDDFWTTELGDRDATPAPPPPPDADESVVADDTIYPTREFAPPPTPSSSASTSQPVTTPAAPEQVRTWVPETQPVTPLSQAPRPEPAARTPPHRPFGDLHAEPLELAREPEPSSPGAILGWSLACFLALLILVGQLLWFNRIELSRLPALAGFYDIACHQIDCAIPPRQAVDLIQSDQLVVRPHPRYRDALTIHLLLENNAGFVQPFPAIDLTFSDIRGRPVASRLLQPADYLDAGLDPLKMPRAQPFEISLAILDPGRRAVSYEVRLAPARL